MKNVNDTVENEKKLSMKKQGEKKNQLIISTRTINCMFESLDDLDAFFVRICHWQIEWDFEYLNLKTANGLVKIVSKFKVNVIQGAASKWVKFDNAYQCLQKSP